MEARRSRMRSSTMHLARRSRVPEARRRRSDLWGLRNTRAMRIVGCSFSAIGSTTRVSGGSFPEIRHMLGKIGTRIVATIRSYVRIAVVCRKRRRSQLRRILRRRAEAERLDLAKLDLERKG